jgi:hypothetical protein
MVAPALQSRTAAPRDGSVYRGFFERATPKGAMFRAVSWDPDQGWVDLLGEVIDEAWHLRAWSPD